MKLRHFIYGIAFLVLFLPFADASSLKYEGWVFNNRYLKTDNHDFKVLVSEGGNSILMKSADTSISLDMDECADREFRRYCLNSSSFDREENEYKVYLSIYYLQPKIEITRTVSDNILSIGEETEFSVVVENTGDADSDNVHFIEALPENLKVDNVNNAELKGNQIEWEGGLAKGDERKITYSAKSIGQFDKSLKASVSYFDGLLQAEIYSSAIRMYSSAILDAELTLDKSDYELREDMELTITLTNNGDRQVDLDGISIIIPENTEVEDSEGALKRSESEYYLTGSLDENETIDIEFSLIPKQAGAFFIVMTGTYNYRGIGYSLDNLKSGYLVHNGGVDLTSNLEGTEYANSNEMKLITVKIKNKNSFSGIKNIRLFTETGLANIEPSRYGRLRVNETIALLNNEFTMPDVQADTTYTLSFNATYQTEDNETYSSKLERRIIVKPIKSLTIKPSFSSISVQEEEPVTIKLSINNPSVKDIADVSVKAELPEGVVAKGATSGYYDLAGSTNQETLSFIIYPSIVADKQDLTVKFIVSYIEDTKEFEVTDQKNISVKPKVPKVKVSKILSASKAYQGELVDVSYIITNEDTVPIYGMVLQTTRSQGADTYNIFNYSLKNLNPGESESFSAEQLRPKKEGKLTVESSILSFTDKYGRYFNASSDSKYIDIMKADIDGPAIYLENTLSNSTIFTGEQLIVTTNITNLGQQKAEGYLYGSQKITIPFYRNTLITKNLSFSREGTYLIEKSVFVYGYLGNNLRAYSNVLTVHVVNRTVSIKGDEQAAAPDAGPGEAVPEKKVGFFRKIALWFVSLFDKV